MNKEMKVKNMDMNKKYELLYKAVKCDINDARSTAWDIGFSTRIFFQMLETEDDETIMDYFNENYGVEI